MARTSTPEPVDDYRAESDHGTLARAEEIRGDGKRMAGVKRHHKKVSKQLGKMGRALGGGGKR